jgi:hypothetical protein
MKRQELLDLLPGDKVFWNDPDDGLCSRFYTIKTIEIGDEIIKIIEADGSVLQCYANELEIKGESPVVNQIRIDHDALVNALVSFIRTADTDTLEAIAAQELSVVKDATFDCDTDSFILDVEPDFTAEQAIEEFKQFGSYSEIVE